MSDFVTEEIIRSKKQESKIMLLKISATKICDRKEFNRASISILHFNIILANNLRGIYDTVVEQIWLSFYSMVNRLFIVDID